ncbi:MAG: hypothetical protein K8R74_06100 [Bacteroidales bacterium]|nr:hypothetical protein [Bacteroidales bacterium]
MRTNLLRLFSFITIFIFLITVWNCTDDITGKFHENQPPDTDLFIKSLSNDTLNYTTSIQKLYWDGRDSDGYICGFYYSWNENPQNDDWQWTTERSLTFPLEISGQDTIYIFQIKAVDNNGAEDPTPAIQRFPIKNTPPIINWTQSSLIPDTTFTVASFVWTASDLDGDSTISHFEYAVDDSTTWRMIPGYSRTITLNADSGIVQGNHVFYIRAVDIAGSMSETIRMPETGAWYAKTPKGRYLLIDDFGNEAQSGYPDAYYQTMLNNVLGQIGNNDDFDYWNIEEQFPASRAQFTETMKLFERIIWYTDIIKEDDEHFIAAQIAIPEFLENGGKIVYTVQFNTGFGSQGDPLGFTPVSDLGNSYRITPGSVYYSDPDSISEFYATFNISLPELQSSQFINGVLALEQKATSVPMYRYDDTETEDDPLFVLIGRNDNTGVYDFVFSGTPLHYLQGNSNLDEFFRIIFQDIFTP